MAYALFFDSNWNLAAVGAGVAVLIGTSYLAAEAALIYRRHHPRGSGHERFDNEEEP